MPNCKPNLNTSALAAIDSRTQWVEPSASICRSDQQSVHQATFSFAGELFFGFAPMMVSLAVSDEGCDVRRGQQVQPMQLAGKPVRLVENSREGMAAARAAQPVPPAARAGSLGGPSFRSINSYTAPVVGASAGSSRGTAPTAIRKSVGRHRCHPCVLAGTGQL